MLRFMLFDIYDPSKSILIAYRILDIQRALSMAPGLLNNARLLFVVGSPR